MTESRRVLITGGAGFMGSHFVGAFLKKGYDVAVFDNLSSGQREFIADYDCELIEADLLDAEAIANAAKGAEILVHAAADPDVRVGAEHTMRHFEQNIMATQHVIEAARKAGVQEMPFMSTSTVYGETKIFPTPVSLGPLKPISTYGASKAACEAMISAHAHTFGFNAIAMRFANIVGPRLTHGVIFDFAHKLKATPQRLEILGDGSQDKSYCHVEDVVNALFTTLESDERDTPFAVYNVGTDSTTTVTRIGEIVRDAMGLSDVEFAYTGGVDGGRGWKGDIKKMLLDASELKALDWSAKHSSDDAVKGTAEWIAARVR